MSTVTKVYIEDLPGAKRDCPRHRGQRAVARVSTLYKAPYGGNDIVRTTYACPACAERAKARKEALG